MCRCLFPQGGDHIRPPEALPIVRAEGLDEPPLSHFPRATDAQDDLAFDRQRRHGDKVALALVRDRFLPGELARLGMQRHQPGIQGAEVHFILV
jgi:hypothetical protein